MQLDYGLGTRILREFRSVRLRAGFLTKDRQPDTRPCAIELNMGDQSRPVLRVVFEKLPHPVPAFATTDFIYEEDGKTVRVKVEPARGNVPRALADRSLWTWVAWLVSRIVMVLGFPIGAGDGVRNVDDNTKGTAGWFFYLTRKSVPRFVCLGNWHVMGSACSNVETWHRLQSVAGKVDYAYPFKYEDPANHWDLALAEFPRDHIEAFVRGRDPRKAYPADICDAAYGDDYECYGWGYGNGRRGTFDSLWSGPVEIASKWACFEGMLKFTRMTRAGDSGALIMRTDDSCAVGIAFAAAKKMTLANPLLELGWVKEKPINGFPHFSDTTHALPPPCPEDPR